MKTFLKITLISFFLFSCHGQNNRQEKSTVKKNQSEESIDFLNKKCFNNYSLIIDESNISDHPFFSYLNCNTIGYFSVHFVAKNSSLQEYWIKEHYKNTDFNTIDLVKDEIRIGEKLNNNFQNYNVFAYYIPNKYLNPKSNCSFENVFCKKDSKAQIYLYNQDSKNWNLLKEIKTEILPPYNDNSFFINSFPNLFNSKKYIIPEGFYSLDTTEISLKLNTYKILTLEKNELKANDNAQHNSNEIVILQKNKNIFYKILNNKKLIFRYDDNCPADGFGGVVTKKNYFTVQQIFCQDFLFVNSYTTFKIDENTGSIILHKYGEEFTDRSNPDRIIPAKTWTSKDFGEMKFEDVTEVFLHKLRSTNPKS